MKKKKPKIIQMQQLSQNCCLKTIELIEKFIKFERVMHKNKQKILNIIFQTYLLSSQLADTVSLTVSLNLSNEAIDGI